MSPLMGVGYSGQYEGKLIWVHHTKDSSLWPPQGVIYRDAVLGAQGETGAKERFRLRWIENAEHGPSAMVPSLPNRASNTWLIDYMPYIEQSLADLIDWVENGHRAGRHRLRLDRQQGDPIARTPRSGGASRR